MLFKYYLSIAEIKVLLETDHPLTRNKEFIPFIINEADPDIYITFSKSKILPEISGKVLFEGECSVITSSEKCDFRKFFYENPEDPVHYAVSEVDCQNGRISVEYLETYGRCVSEIQNSFYHIVFESVLLQKNKLCIHAACVDTALGGLLFTGNSGIGKSTQAELWCRYRDARQINGDRPILSKEGTIWTAWGSPYAGSSKCHVNEKCCISAIILLKQSNVCTLRKLEFSEAFRKVWAGVTIHTWEATYVEKASNLALDLIVKIPVFEFGCTPDEEAVDFLEQTLRKEYHL